jgi:hypothetical protein
MPQALNRLKAEVAASVGQVNAAKPAGQAGVQR